jgi:aminoglycoside phosphotransferase (APT) family kinase protein
MKLQDEKARENLADYLSRHLCGSDVAINSIERMSGGAIQENWALSVRVDGGEYGGPQSWVLRCNPSAKLTASLSKSEEFSILSIAHGAEVRVPKPILLCKDSRIIGSDFFIMERAQGTGAAYKLVKDNALVPDRPALLGELGRNLARLHAVKPPLLNLAFLGPAPLRPTLENIGRQRAFLDMLPEAQPVLEWGLRWLETNAPMAEQACLVHRDFRTGNFLVHQGNLAAILHWEFADWGNPHEDIGWLFAKCWRFGQVDRRAGGIGDAEDFLIPYEEHCGHAVDRQQLVYWEVLAHIRWAVIALQQAERHMSGEQRSLELALTGRIVSALEAEILRNT